ncbi:MAG: hypothetical protein BIFFINMI_02439 [Phycisphaerae bacterium]|nr:hypothetical protein [Phycisphaerae bacterium]
MLSRVKRTLVRFLNDDGGDVKIEYLLLLAVIALPLLGLLIWYRDDLGKWLGQKWEQYRTPGQGDPVRPSDSQGP